MFTIHPSLLRRRADILARSNVHPSRRQRFSSRAPHPQPSPFPLRSASACSFLSFLPLLACFTLTAGAADLITVAGITEPFRDVTLSAPVTGIISAEFFKEGQQVKEGDVILELDKKLEELEVSRRKAVMDRAKMDLDSTLVLVKTTKAVSKEELDKKQTEYNVAAAEHGIAAEQLARRQIVAPFAGSICEISLQVGAACAPYQPLVRLVDTTRCFFVGHIEGKAAAALRLDQPVRLEIEGITAPATAKICFISPVVDPASGLARIKAIFENRDAVVRPGLAARLIPQ